MKRRGLGPYSRKVLGNFLDFNDLSVFSRQTTNFLKIFIKYEFVGYAHLISIYDALFSQKYFPEIKNFPKTLLEYHLASWF